MTVIKSTKCRTCKTCGAEFLVSLGASTKVYCRPECRESYSKRKADYEARQKEDEGKFCAMCGRKGIDRYPTTQTIKNLFRDHCHKTHKRRGLLCNRCNLALGYLEDDVDRLQAGIEYLNFWKAAHAVEDE